MVLNLKLKVYSTSKVRKNVILNTCMFNFHLHFATKKTHEEYMLQFIVKTNVNSWRMRLANVVSIE